MPKNEEIKEAEVHWIKAISKEIVLKWRLSIFLLAKQ